MKSISHKLITMLVILVFSSAAIADEPEFKCPSGVRLLKDAPPEDRRLSLSSLDEPFFLSEQFCFVLAGRRLQLHEAHFPLAYDSEQFKNLIINYQQAYRSIADLDKRLNFAHLFVRALTQKAIVTGLNPGKPRADVLVAAKMEKGAAAWHLLPITPDMGHLDALAKLGALQNNPPLAKDHPKLMKLVELVLDVSKIVSDDELYALEQGYY